MPSCSTAPSPAVPPALLDQIADGGRLVAVLRRGPGVPRPRVAPQRQGRRRPAGVRRRRLRRCRASRRRPSSSSRLDRGAQSAPTACSRRALWNSGNAAGKSADSRIYDCKSTNAGVSIRAESGDSGGRPGRVGACVLDRALGGDGSACGRQVPRIGSNAVQIGHRRWLCLCQGAGLAVLALRRSWSCLAVAPEAPAPRR